MKLIGYLHLAGERDGKKYDDYRLFISSENVKPNTEKGGQQILQVRTAYGSFFPKISAMRFNELVSQGMSIGSELKMYRDAGDNSLIVELV